MRIATWKQIDEKKETYQVWVDEKRDENENVIVEGHLEERIRIVPIYGIVYEEEDDILQEELPTGEEATEADYQEALAEMGVNLNE